MTSWGLENDRVYMIVNDKGVFVSQRELPHMVLIHPERGGEGSCLFFTYVRWVNLKIGGFSNMYDCHLHRRFPFSVPPSCPRLVHPAHVFLESFPPEVRIDWEFLAFLFLRGISPWLPQIVLVTSKAFVLNGSV